MVFSQEQKQPIVLQYDDISLTSALDDLATKTDTRLYFKKEWFQSRNITFFGSFLTPTEAVNSMLAEVGLSYDYIKGSLYVLYNQESNRVITKDIQLLLRV